MHPPSTIPLTGGELCLDERVFVRSDGERVSLTWMESRVLAYLAARDGPVPTDELLTEVWGYSEKAVSKTVATTVRRIRRKIEETPKKPRHLMTARGAYLLRWERPASLDVDPHATELLAPPRPLLGRDAFIEQVLEALADPSGSFVVQGPPGAGKSAVLAATAQRWVEDGHPVAWVDLEGVDERDALLTRVARGLVLRVSEVADAAALRAVIRDALQSNSDLLLVLDHVEEANRWLPELVGGLPSGRVLIGTRIAPASLDGLRVSLEPLDPASARTLLGGGDSVELEELIGRLDGNPLALELARARLRTLAPEELCRLLDRGVEVLSTREARGSSRWSSLAAALETSWNAIGPSRRRLLCSLTSFAREFDLAGAEAVSGRSGPEVLDDLEELLDHSLLRFRRAGTGREGRFSLPGTVRAFAEQAPEASPDRLREHALHVLERSEQLSARVRGPQGLGALRRLALQTPELEVVWARFANVEPSLGARVLACTEHLAWREPGWSLLARADALLAHASVLDADGRSAVHYLRGLSLAALGRPAESLAALGAVEGEGGPTGWTARARIRSVHLLARLGRREAARSAGEQGLRLAAETDTPHLVADAEVALGILALGENRLQDALEGFRRALARFRDLGDRWGEGILHLNLGIAFRRLALREDAIHHYEEAVDILGEWDDRSRLSTALNNLANALLLQGRLDEAEAAYRKAIGVRRQMGNRVREGQAMSNLAALLLEQGRHDEALVLLDRCLRLHREVGDARYEAQTLMNRSMVLLVRREFARASSDISLSIERYLSWEDELAAALASSIAGLTQHLLGNLDAASALYTEALELLHRARSDRGLPETLARVAVLEAEKGNHEAAWTRLHAARESLHSETDASSRAAFPVLEAATLHLLGEPHQDAPPTADGTSEEVLARVLFERVLALPRH